MSVLCYFPWNLRLQSAVRLLFPILPEDIIHPGSWLKSGISARLDNLNLRTYALPFEKVTLCLEHNLSFLLLLLCSFGKWNISQKFWKYPEQGDIWLNFGNFTITVVFLVKFLTYLSICFLKFQSKGPFHLLFTHIMTKPRCSKCLKISKESRPSLSQRLSHFSLEKTSQLHSLFIDLLL